MSGLNPTYLCSGFVLNVCVLLVAMNLSDGDGKTGRLIDSNTDTGLFYIHNTILIYSHTYTYTSP